LVNINNIHIFALTETHLDASVNDWQITINGYSLLGRDRNRNGGGVALYIQNHIHFKRRDDNICQIEALWAQVHLLHQAPILVGCVFRPPSSKVSYLDYLCTGFEQATDRNRDAIILGDFNINWKDHNSSNITKLLIYAESCGLKQLVNDTTKLGQTRALI
jgi:exonuclease III